MLPYHWHDAILAEIFHEKRDICQDICLYFGKLEGTPEADG
jgi:hypothetical protein